MTPDQARNLARQCLHCGNLLRCKDENWPVVWDGINCDNFISKEAIPVAEKMARTYDGSTISSSHEK